MLFQIHPDQRIKLIDDSHVEYSDTIENFIADSGATIPTIPDGAGIIIDDWKTAMFVDGNQVAADDEMIGFAVYTLAKIQDYLSNQVTRRLLEAEEEEDE